MADCIFCKIINGEIPAEIVYSDAEVVAFKDIQPLAPVHLLLVPRRHLTDLTALTEADVAMIGHLHLVAVQLARELGIADRGFRLAVNCLEEGGQLVPHVHYHLLGGRRLSDALG